MVSSTVDIKLILIKSRGRSNHFRFLHFQFGHCGCRGVFARRKALKYDPRIGAKTLVFSTTIFLSAIGRTFFFFFLHLIVRAPIVIASFRSDVTTSRHFSDINCYPRQPCTFSCVFTSNLNPAMQLTGLCHRTWMKPRRCRAERT